MAMLLCPELNEQKEVGVSEHTFGLYWNKKKDSNHLISNPTFSLFLNGAITKINMSKGWSFSRSSGKKAKGEVEKVEDVHMRRPGPKIERSRPSSMVSIAFPSTSTSNEFDQIIDTTPSTTPRKSAQSFSNKNSKNGGSSGALNLLNVTQQKDLARRERKSSTTSTSSSLQEASSSNGGDSSSSNSKSNQPNSPRRRQISSSNTVVPSLIKSPARSSALSSTSNEYTQFTVSSKPNSEEVKKSSKKLEKMGRDDKNGHSKERESGNNDLQSHSKGKAGKSRTLGDITNQSKSDVQLDKSKEDTSTNQEVEIGNSQHSIAVDSLMMLRGDKKGKRNAAYSGGSKGSIDKSLGSTQHASLVITSPKLKQGQFENETVSRPDKQLFPYTIRKNSGARSIASYSSNPYISIYDHSSRGRRSDKQSKCARYEFTYFSGRSTSMRFQKDRQLVQSQREYKLIGIGIPTTFGSDRLTNWVVERAARLASCVINLIGS